LGGGDRHRAITIIIVVVVVVVVVVFFVVLPLFLLRHPHDGGDHVDHLGVPLDGIQNTVDKNLIKALYLTGLVKYIILLRY